MAKSGIFQGIQREHVLQAMQDYDAGLPHEFGESKKYDLVEGGKRYPPKAIVGLASQRATGRVLMPADFSGGQASCNGLLRELGFSIEPKSGPGSDDEQVLDRSDPDSAGEAFELLFAKWPDLREPWLNLLDDCMKGFTDNPTSWSLTVSKSRCILNAGRAALLGLSKSGMLFTCSIAGLDDEDRAWLRDHGTKDLATFEHYPELALVQVTGEQGVEAIQRFRERILQASEAAMATPLKRAPMWRTHSDGGLVYLEDQLGHKLPRPDLETGGRGRSYWKLAPETGAQLWDEWRENGYASIGWTDLGDVRRFPDREAFEEARAALEFSKNGAGQVWKFRHFAPGDVIVANRGIGEIVGVGDVTSDYYFDASQKEHPHRVKVSWRDMEPIAVSQPGWRRTLIPLGTQEFKRLVGASEPTRTSTVSGGQVDDEAETGRFDQVLARLEDKDLQFSEEQVADFLLALQTKRFVILSGVSGTGKSRIAIETARAFQPTVARKVVPDEPEAGTVLHVLPYMLGYNRFILPAAFVAELDLPPRENGSLLVTVETPKGRETQRLTRHKDRDVAALLLRGGRARLVQGDAFTRRCVCCRREGGG